MYDFTKKTMLHFGVLFILIGCAFLLYDGLLLFYTLIVLLDYIGFILISSGTLFICAYIASEHKKFENIDRYMIFIAIVLFLIMIPPILPFPDIIEATIVLAISPFLIAVTVFHVATIENPNTKIIFPLTLWATQLLFYTIWDGINYLAGYVIIISNSSTLFLLNIMIPMIFTSFLEIYTRKKRQIVLE